MFCVTCDELVYPIQGDYQYSKSLHVTETGEHVGFGFVDPSTDFTYLFTLIIPIRRNQTII